MVRVCEGFDESSMLVSFGRHGRGEVEVTRENDPRLSLGKGDVSEII